MGPEAAKSFAGQALVDVTMRPAQRATQEIDYGRRGKGYVFGAFQPHTGAAFTWTAQRRTTANVVAFLEQVETWIAPSVERVYAILDNLSAHRATDVLFFALAHPRWEFVFQPKYAAYLNLIEPWWKILRSLALKGSASRPGRRSDGCGLRCHRLLERAIAIPSSGDADVVTSRDANQALH